MPQGSFGRIRAWNDFLAVPPHTAADTVVLANGSLLGGGWGLISVNEGTTIATVDEPGGVLAITTDTGDNDNAFIAAGAFTPADGGMVCEFRMKSADYAIATSGSAVFAGFSETLAVGTPVLPLEIAASTATYSATGGFVGFLFDSDATDNPTVPSAQTKTGLYYRFVAGDAGAVLASKDYNGTAGPALGIDCEINANGTTMTGDKFLVFRVEVDPDGLARGYVGDMQSGEKGAMRLVGTTTAALGTTDNFHACAGIENRHAGAEVLEIDYAYAQGWRDWTP